MAGFKSIGRKATKFGGRRVTKESPPDKKILESYGGARPKVKPIEARTPGNKEFGFIQSTEKKATGAMMGRPPPKKSTKTSTRKDSRKQFKPKAGARVF